MKTTIDDFWRMVWQQNSDKIVMLTNVLEQGVVSQKQNTCFAKSVP